MSGPILIFDSGVGGLSVVKALREQIEDDRDSIGQFRQRQGLVQGQIEHHEREEKNLELAEHDMNVIQPSDTLMEELRAIGAVMLEEWVEQTGNEGRALVEAWSDR